MYVIKLGGGRYILSCDTIADGRRYPVIYADKHVMPAGEHELSFKLWINSDIDFLFIRFTAEKPVSELSVERIIIKRSFRETFTYLMLQVFTMLLVIDGVLIAFLNRGRLGNWLRKRIYIVLGLLAILGISALPVFMDSLAAGHDIYFHLSRIAGLAEGITAGQLPVRIQPGWCNNYGYAVSVFYGDILLYIPAVLYLTGVPLLHAYHAYLLMIHIGTVAISYYSYKRLCGDKYIALFCTALTCLSINRIFNVYVRAALGEYSAYMFFPIVIVGMKEILCGEEKRILERDKSNAWLFLGIGMAGILQTHILSFEMVCILLGLVVILRFRSMLCLNRVQTILKAVILTIGLSAWFLIPVLDYSARDLVIFREKEACYIQGYGLSLYELFSMTTRTSGGINFTEEGLSNRLPISLGIVVIFMIFIEIVALIRFEWDKWEKRRLLFMSGITGVCIWMATEYFPWNRLAVMTGVRDSVYSFQFPWRFLSLAIPLFAYTASLVLVKIKECIQWNESKKLLLFLCLLTALQGMYVTDLSLQNSRKGVYDGAEMLRADYVLEGAEYLFIDTDREQMQNEAEVFGKNVRITAQMSEGNVFQVTCSAGTNAYLEIPLLAYKYYKCIDVQSDTELLVTHGSNHKIRVDLPEYYQGTLKVFFKEPWYWRTAEMLSLFTLLMLLIGFCYKNRLVW